MWHKWDTPVKPSTSLTLLTLHQCQSQTKVAQNRVHLQTRTFINVKTVIYWFRQWSEPDSMWSHAANRYMTHIASGSASLPLFSTFSPALWKASPDKPSASSSLAAYFRRGRAATHGANIRPDSCSASAKTSRTHLGAAGLSPSLTWGGSPEEGGEERKAMDHRLRIKGFIFLSECDSLMLKVRGIKAKKIKKKPRLTVRGFLKLQGKKSFYIT